MHHPNEIRRASPSDVTKKTPTDRMPLFLPNTSSLECGGKPPLSKRQHAAALQMKANRTARVIPLLSLRPLSPVLAILMPVSGPPLPSPMCLSPRSGFPMGARPGTSPPLSCNPYPIIVLELPVTVDPYGVGKWHRRPYFSSCRRWMGSNDGDTSGKECQEHQWNTPHCIWLTHTSSLFRIIKLI
jgi:hypothetical protein